MNSHKTLPFSSLALCLMALDGQTGHDSSDGSDDALVVRSCSALVLDDVGPSFLADDCGHGIDPSQTIEARAAYVQGIVGRHAL